MWRELLGLDKKPQNLMELLTPRHSFADVVLPDDTRKQLYEALTQIEKHRLIFGLWGLGERHPNSMGLAFNFAGPPGTGKSICAEAVAYALGRKLLRVRYSELESCWVGETGKNLRTVFRDARTQGAVLFFDEADSVASRRFSNVQSGHERESNQAVSVLLMELEEHDGVVIFATNMAANFDPAFERRVRTHILFRAPNRQEREKIWKLQIHPQKTPLGADVDFGELAATFEVTGGDIRNAVLKAAMMSAAEDGPDETKRILQKHFLAGMEQVIQGKQTMHQTVASGAAGPFWEDALDEVDARLTGLDAGLASCRLAVQAVVDDQLQSTERTAAIEEGVRQASLELSALRGELCSQLSTIRTELLDLREALSRQQESQNTALQVWKGEHETAVRGVDERLRQQEERLARATLLPWTRGTTVAGLTMLALLLLALGALGARAFG